MKRALSHDWFPRELPAGLELGTRSYLYSSFAFLHLPAGAQNEVRIGDDTGVYQGTFFELGRGARVGIGRFCTVVGAVIRAEREVKVGDYVFIAHEVVISDCDGPGVVCSLPSEGRLSPPGCTPRPVTIGDDVWVGMRAVILAGVTVGRGAVIGAGAVVSNDVPPYAVVTGNPARLVRMLTPAERGGVA